MSEKYKTVDMPIGAWENFKKTQEKMNEAFKKMTGKEKNIPLTKVMKIKAEQPTYLFDSEIVRIFKKGKQKL